MCRAWTLTTIFASRSGRARITATGDVLRCTAAACQAKGRWLALCLGGIECDRAGSQFRTWMSAQPKRPTVTRHMAVCQSAAIKRRRGIGIQSDDSWTCQPRTNQSAPGFDESEGQGPAFLFLSERRGRRCRSRPRPGAQPRGKRDEEIPAP